MGRYEVRRVSAAHLHACGAAGHRGVYASSTDRGSYMSSTVPPNAAMAKLWKRTFVAERDRRAGPDANAQRKGQISRQLKAQLEKALSDGND